MILDPSTLVLLTMIYRDANPDVYINLSHIDILISMCKDYSELHSHTNWENEMIDWESSVIHFYNRNKPENWNEYETT